MIRTYSKEIPYIHTIDVDTEKEGTSPDDCGESFSKGNLATSLSDNKSFRKQLNYSYDSVDNLGISITNSVPFLEERSLTDNLGVSLGDLSNRSALSAFSAKSPSPPSFPDVELPSFSSFDVEASEDPYDFNLFTEHETSLRLRPPIFSSTPKKATRSESEVASDKDMDISCDSSNLTISSFESDGTHSKIHADVDELSCIATPKIHSKASPEGRFITLFLYTLLTRLKNVLKCM